MTDVTINPNYLRQLIVDAQTRGQVSPKTEKLERALFAILSGRSDVGSRSPLGLPTWITLEVAHGGFATGELSAAGPLLPHENALSERVGIAATRAALNQYFLSDQGFAELRQMLSSGCYRVRVPEEAALLTVAYLIDRAEHDAAATLLETIAPYFDQLRFYPEPASDKLVSGLTVYRFSARDVAADIDVTKVQPNVLQMNRALCVWRPLTNRLADLLAETLNGAYPADWLSRAQQLRDEHDALWKSQVVPARWRDAKETLPKLRRYLDQTLAQTISEGGAKGLSQVLQNYFAKYGSPGSELRQRRTADELAHGTRPLYQTFRQVLKARLERYPEDVGLVDPSTVTGPVSEAESRNTLSAGAELPPHVQKIASRCVEGTLEDLVKFGVVPSAEVLATLVPQVSAYVESSAFVDDVASALFAANYLAFRKRRSLLLLNLESQVRFTELPWLQALKKCQQTSAAEEVAARTLAEVAVLYLVSFPQTIVPNKLVTELSSLSRAAKLDLPWVKEVASDIFMGTFAMPFLKSAQLAARLLKDTLYTRYYGIDWASVEAMPEAKPPSLLERVGSVVSGALGVRSAPLESKEFAEACRQRADTFQPNRSAKVENRVVTNGKIIEQTQILTTHNLATLFAIPTVRERVTPKLPDMTKTSMAFVKSSLKDLDRVAHRVKLQALKNAAFAVRQAMFFASFVESPNDCLLGPLDLSRHPHVSDRWLPMVGGFDWALAGNTFTATQPFSWTNVLRGTRTQPENAVQFLGWTSGPHWYLQ